MNSNNLIEPQATTKQEEFSIVDLDFRSIDGPNTGLRPFPLAMLRLGRILLTKEFEKRGFTAYRACNLLEKHRDKISDSFTPLEVREQLWTHSEDIRGGGIKVEWFELPDPHRRNEPPHFSISFSRILRPEDWKVIETPHEPV